MLRRVLVLALALCAALGVAQPALAGCGDAIRDEFLNTGAVASTHEQACYQDALDNLPADIREYTDAEAVIQAAMARDAAAGQSGASVAAGATTTAAAITPPAEGSDGVPVAVFVLGGIAAILVGIGVAAVALRRTRRG